jgi:hypothetical protein
MLEKGSSGNYLQMLASLTEPFNHFEVAEYRDRSLGELGVAELDDEEAVTLYAAEQLRLAVESKQDLLLTLKTVKNLSVALDNPKKLYDFYLLYFAYAHLLESEVQWYWEGADRSNIQAIIRERINVFLLLTGDA